MEEDTIRTRVVWREQMVVVVVLSLGREGLVLCLHQQGSYLVLFTKGGIGGSVVGGWPQLVIWVVVAVVLEVLHTMVKGLMGINAALQAHHYIGQLVEVVAVIM